MYYDLSSHKRNQYDIAANESDLDTIHKVWPQTQTTYIWGPSTILPDAEPALLNPYNQTIFWQIVAKNLVHSDPYSKINLALSRNEIIVFHEIVWQSNNLQRYRSYDVNIPLWEGNQAADTFSQLSKWNRSPVSVGAIDAIYILGVVKWSNQHPAKVSM